MYFIVKLIKIMVILVFFLVISVNRRLFRYFGSYSGISVIPVILVNRRTPETGYLKPVILKTEKDLKTIVQLPSGQWGLESHCILGIADERRSLSLFFCCLILPLFEKVPTYCWVHRDTFPVVEWRNPASNSRFKATFCTITEPL